MADLSDIDKFRLPLRIRADEDRAQDQYQRAPPDARAQLGQDYRLRRRNEQFPHPLTHNQRPIGNQQKADEDPDRNHLLSISLHTHLRLYRIVPPRSPLAPRAPQEGVNPAPSVELVLVFLCVSSASPHLRVKWTASLVPLRRVRERSSAPRGKPR